VEGAELVLAEMTAEVVAPVLAAIFLLYQEKHRVVDVLWFHKLR
jgi:hypothetical protein